MKIKLVIFSLLFAVNTIFSQEKTPFKIVVQNLNEQGKYQQMVTDAIALLNEVLNTPEFKQKVESHTYDWVDVDGAYKNLTGKQIFDILYVQKPLATMNLYIKSRGVRLGAYFSGTLGVTSVNTNSTRTYKHWLDLSDQNYQKTVVEYASHIAHEYCHQRGFFDKDYDQPSYREVVPYAIGDIVCELLNKKLGASYRCNE